MPYLTVEVIGTFVDRVEHACWQDAADWKATGVNVELFYQEGEEWVPVKDGSGLKLV